MSLTLRSSFRRAAGLLAILALCCTNAQAQSAPPWQGVTATNAHNSGKGVVDAAGNFYAMGVFNGSVTVGSVTLTSQVNNSFLAKYGPTGQLLWVRQLASPAFTIAEDVAVDAAGNAYVSGVYAGGVALGNNVTLPSPNGQTQAFVVRYSPQGAAEWVQFSAPGSAIFRSLGVETDAAGHVFLLGDYVTLMQMGGVTISAGSAGAMIRATYLARLSAATGVVEWLRTAFQFPSTTNVYGGRQLAVGAAGEPVVLTSFVGAAPIIPQGPVLTPTSTAPPSTAADVAVIKYSALLTCDWAQQINGPDGTFVSGGALDAAGNVYVSGGMLGPATFGSTTLPHAGGSDAFLAKYAPTGALLWARGGGGPAQDGWNHVSLDAAGNAYLAGYAEGTAQYGTTTITSAGATDVLLASYSPQGQLRWTQQAGSPANDQAFYLGLDAAGTAYVRGAAEGPAAFGAFTLPGQAAPSYFLARLGTPLATRPARAAATELFPSPAHDQLYLPALPAGTPVQLLDALGRVARAARVTAGQVSVRGLPAGLYTLRALDAQGRPSTGRVVVE
ncbi:T9SS type A sorting domain-containing protein [Hymenobacter jeollabukensis]|uniref:T9SS type A sorting domain-containing protein n=1 Tax=Hymenobacter jeollabukensis TaxID=2025313 RepID=A0A5R8WNT6_9BACT|nr:T9SS type A sorting domain-containing protein [Hymenobacter jeollabukensis]TLM91082.1 T9SS type A sorting domain-containing protein [Hymenobacter jeollabukensis]